LSAQLDIVEDVSDLQCPVTVLVVRHGESEGNVGRRLSAAAPGEPLTAQGRGQAAALAQRLRTRKIAYVYASPLLRAQQTGQILAEALGVGLGTVDGVQEVSMGRCEGSVAAEDWAYIDASFLRWGDDDLAARIDGGESGHEIVHRMRSALGGIADQHRGETVVVVSHGGTMACALPRCATDVPDDYGRGRFVPNCGMVELSVDADDWSLRQWPGDPDRGPHPGDLVDLVGRAEADQAREVSTAEIHGVPCTSFDIDPSWATRATLTGRADVPGEAELDDVLGWLQARRPGSWQVRARIEQADDPVLCQRLVPVLELGVWITDRWPRYEVPDDCEIGEARDAGEFLTVFGAGLAPVIAGQIGTPSQSFLVLRRQGDTIGCARVSLAGGTAGIYGVSVLPEHRGQGFGRLISAAAIEHAVRATGIAWLHSEDTVAPLYEQLGLRRLTTHVDLEPKL
jgi:probable phosphoglycerate mutase